MKRRDYKMYIVKERPNDVPFFSAVELGSLVPQFTQRTKDKSFMNTLAVSTQVSVWRRAATTTEWNRDNIPQTYTHRRAHAYNRNNRSATLLSSVPANVSNSRTGQYNIYVLNYVYYIYNYTTYLYMYMYACSICILAEISK